jgi:undecaprenyl diphosphate synthase
MGLEYLTLYTFSTENWNRPQLEVQFLMRLLRRQLIREQKTLMANNIRFRVIGDMERLPLPVRQILLQTIEMTKNNSGMVLVFALSYGGRQEIREAVKKIARDAQAGRLDPEQIDEATVTACMESAFMPDPDLVIRTSGELRLSNFLLWQSAYSEFYVSEKLWPDFTKEDFFAALGEFKCRNRRFGRVDSTESQKSHVGP